jgi:hypothetical protein
LDITEITRRLNKLDYQSLNEQRISSEGESDVCYAKSFGGLLLELVQEIPAQYPESQIEETYDGLS